MVKRVQIVGHTTVVANAFIGLSREVTVDTTLNELRVHDGITPGGHRILNKAEADALYAVAGVNDFDDIFTNIIGEHTVNAGVTIDGVLVKDGLVDGADVSALAASFVAHAANVSNPHVVTKTQVGLSLVLNAIQLQVGQNLADLNNAATARTNLGVGIGVAVQAFDATLAALAALDGTQGLLAVTAADTFARRTLTGTASQIAVANGAGIAGDPTFTIAANPTLPGTGGALLPIGNTAQRAGTEGAVRYNSQTDQFEFNVNGAWQVIDFTSLATIPNAVKLLLSGTMAAAATLDLNIGQFSTYRHIQIRLSAVHSITDLRDLLMRVAVDAVPTFDASAVYSYQWQSQSAGGVLAGAAPGNGTSIQLNGADQLGSGAGASEQFYAIIDIYHPNDVDDFTTFTWLAGQRSSSTGRPEVIEGFGSHDVVDNVTFIRFLLSAAGNFTCKWSIYGWP